MKKSKKVFAPVDPKVNFVELEKKWLEWWEKNGILKKYLGRNSSSSKKFSFLDGPITANNPMAVHHAWGRTYKDLWQRFNNMRGFKQRFQNGFDNQGLWVEVIVEKELGFKSKKDIEDYGIEKFVNKCKEATLSWAKVQTEQSKRLGYFMDWEQSYFTLSNRNNYMIWYFLKKCHERKLLYKGKDSVPWCPRCGTAISQHEILQEEYKELTHESIYFRLPIKERKGEYFLVWTTTPWTLPGNVALAVHPDLEYQMIEISRELCVWLVKSQVGKLFGENAKVLKTLKGSEMAGWRYQAAFDGLEAVLAAGKEKPKTFHTVVEAEDLVSETEGTGIVHIATGCGQEDFALGKEKDLPVIAVIDEAANYLGGFGDLTGKNAKDNPDLVLKHPLLADYVFKIEKITHRYPVCWRCKTELVWRVVDEWYIKMDPLRESLKTAARGARWIPSWGLDRELDWLDHMSDWLISKKRYWGLALPIWECECGNFEVIGSEEELKERAVKGYDKFSGHSPHRPWVDNVKINCSNCGKEISRIKDVGNPWLDAGIVPFSTITDPSSPETSYTGDKKYWSEWFPADFITECFPGQFKNWFYAILAMSTVLENKAPFKTLFGHALVVDEKGEEMHKTKGNAINFDEGAEKIGVDVMRWLYVTQNPLLNLRFGYHVADETRRRFHLLLWNVYNFFVTYASLDAWEAGKEEENSPSQFVLDRWIVSRLQNTIKTVTESLENYDAYNASLPVESFVQDLSVWYIRRSRDRVGPSAVNNEERNSFYQTAYFVLTTLSKILAPFVPFLSEEMFKNLSDGPSVHLEDWPLAEEEKIDQQLEGEMVRARIICEMGHSKRKGAGIKVKQPLPSISVSGEKIDLREAIVKLVKEELNVKEVVFKQKEGEFSVDLDTKITPQLKEEGEAREVIRLIQEARKEAGCGLNDWVEVSLPQWPGKFEEEIKRKTLAKSLYVSKELKLKPLKSVK